MQSLEGGWHFKLVYSHWQTHEPSSGHNQTFIQGSGKQLQKQMGVLFLLLLGRGVKTLYRLK